MCCGARLAIVIKAMKPVITPLLLVEGQYVYGHALNYYVQGMLYQALSIPYRGKAYRPTLYKIPVFRLRESHESLGIRNIVSKRSVSGEELTYIFEGYLNMTFYNLILTGLRFIILTFINILYRYFSIIEQCKNILVVGAIIYKGPK